MDLLELSIIFDIVTEKNPEKIVENIIRAMYSPCIHKTYWRVLMKATIVDLRYKMNDVLKALDRNEKVTVFYRGKVKGTLIPSGKKTQLKISDHPFFGMSPSNNEKTVQDVMDDLRGSRYNDI